MFTMFHKWLPVAFLVGLNCLGQNFIPSPKSSTVANLPTYGGSNSNLVSTTLSGWSLSGVTQTNTIPDPTGSSNAYRLNASAGSSQHQASVTSVALAGFALWTFQVQANTDNYVLVTVNTDVSNATVQIDCGAGTATMPGNPPAGWAAYMSRSVTNPVGNLPNGFFTVYITFNATSSITNLVKAVSNSTYTGTWTAAGTEKVNFYNDTVKAISAPLPATNDIYTVTDGVSAQDCVTGGATGVSAYRVQCQWNGVYFQPALNQGAIVSGSAFLPSNPINTNQAVAVGDSISTINSGYINATTPTATFVYNTDAAQGRRAAWIRQNVSTTCARYAPMGQYNIVSVLAGVNDIYQDAATAANVQGYLQSIHAQLHACGFKTIANTITPCGTATCTAGNQTTINSVNTWLRANWTAFADTLVDLAANTNLSDPTNLTYYDSGQLHQTAAGTAIISTLVTAGINAITNGICRTFQKSESAADTNVLTCTPPSTPGTYRINFAMSVSAANTATLGWTATWKDSNSASQAPTNLTLVKSGVAAPALTFSAAANDAYYGEALVDIDNSGTAIVVKLTFSGTSFTAKVTATVEPLQ